MSAEHQRPQANEGRPKGGIRLKNAHHLVLMALPNMFNPHKLKVNVTHPVHEVLHTNHHQYPLGEARRHVVEHTLFNRQVAVDIIEKDTFPKGFIARFKQLFDRNYYYGHGEYFPKPFRLVDRTYIRGNNFDTASHIDGFRSKPA